MNVTAEVAPLNTQDGAIKGAVVVQQEIQDVPLDGRDFTDIAFLVSQARRTADMAGLKIRCTTCAWSGAGPISTVPTCSPRYSTIHCRSAAANGS